MNLKTRLLGFAALLVLLSSVASWLVFQHIAEGIIEHWGRQMAETQVRYDSARLLRPLEREIALARQMADSHALLQWAGNSADPQLKARALAEMESFRRNFRDQSFFVALLTSREYYHNNAKNEYAGKELRYLLDPFKPADAWFYRLIEKDRDFHLNVKPDVELGVTKLWIDVLMRDGERAIGIVGTGLELSSLLKEMVDVSQPGVSTLFTDQSGAIQLYRDPRFIDYASVVKAEGQKNTLDQLLTDTQDMLRVQTIMHELRNQPANQAQVRSDFVSFNGKRHLIGIAYLPTLDWFEITLLDLDVVMPLRSLMGAAVVFALTLLVSLLLMAFMLRKNVLNPLRALERAMEQVREGEIPDRSLLPKGEGEIGRLVEHFTSMADAIQNNTRQLEDKVQERTVALEQLARVDALTGLLNRRGMSERLDEELDRATRQNTSFAVLWLDVDNFKQINDCFGHGVGDQALIAVTGILKRCLRHYECASRWGGDEFLVLLSPCDKQTLQRIGERIRALVEIEGSEPEMPLTVSIGGHLFRPGESLDQVLQQADEALYKAKAAGRNAFRQSRT